MTRHLRRRIELATLAATIAFAGATAPPEPAPQQQAAVPAGARVRFHVVAPLSSDGSTTGQSFSFVLLDPIVAGGRTIAAPGAAGAGTVLLAGKAGSGGHEGDLTLRLDSVPTVDGLVLYFDDQQVRINGKNAKAASALLGFVPIVGIAAEFIRGAEIRIGTTTPIETTLLHAAIVAPERNGS